MLIKDNRNVITRLDKLIGNYKNEAPDFVDGYFKAKLIFNTGIHHSGISVIIKDKAGILIRDAVITLTGKKSSKTATMSDDGTYTITKCIAGYWSLTIVAPGYETQTVEMKIIRGAIQKLNIAMQAGAFKLPEIQTA